MENIAHAIALAATSDIARGRTYNVCDDPSLPELDWQRKIASVMTWPGEFVVLPREPTPTHLLQPGNAAQHMVASSDRIRTELGYKEPVEISEAYGKLLESGRRDGKGGLSPCTVHHVHRVLYEVLGQAERWKLIVRNPAALLEKRDRPKIERKTVVTIDAPTTATVFDAGRECRLFIPLILAALCGLRRGEITALRWRSVDLEAGQLAVVDRLAGTDVEHDQPVPDRHVGLIRQGGRGG